MLFVLPAAAAAENWVWESIDVALTAAFDAIDAELAPKPWLDVVAPQYRSSLDRAPLTAGIVGVIAAYSALSLSDRAMVREAQNDQRDLSSLFEGMHTAAVRLALPESIRDPLMTLAEASWNVLKPLGVRKRSYKAFYDSLPDKVCAFCGLEAFQTVDLNRETLDHYLPRTHYPFLVANMRNLVWMSRTCNSGYKHAKDTLRTDSGTRRACYNPYDAPGVSINLLSSTLFGRGPIPTWVINIEGDPEKCKTWDELFMVRSRWMDHLDKQHETCLKNVGTILRSQAANSLKVLQSVVETLIEMATNEGSHAFAFLRRAILELWKDRLAVAGAERDRLVDQLVAARMHGSGRL